MVKKREMLLASPTSPAGALLSVRCLPQRAPHLVSRLTKHIACLPIAVSRTASAPGSYPRLGAHRKHSSSGLELISRYKCYEIII